MIRREGTHHQATALYIVTNLASSHTARIALNDVSQIVPSIKWALENPTEFGKMLRDFTVDSHHITTRLINVDDNRNVSSER